MSRLSAAILLMLMSSTATCADVARSVDRAGLDRDGIRSWSTALARAVRSLVARVEASERGPRPPRTWVDSAVASRSDIRGQREGRADELPGVMLIDLPPPTA